MVNWKKFGSISNKDNKSSSQNASSTTSTTPAIKPGECGNFPPSFNIYFAGVTQDKKSHRYVLGQQPNKPLYVFAIQQGMTKQQITLHAGPSYDAPPLAFAGIEKFFSSNAIITLPASAEAKDSSPVVVPLKFKFSIKVELYSFAVQIADGDTETFEWRAVEDFKNPKPVERDLVRLKGAGGVEEVVGHYSEDPSPEAEGRVGGFEFRGSGAEGGLGHFWTLMAVASLLRTCQVKWEGTVAADKMIQAGEKVASLALGLAF